MSFSDSSSKPISVSGGLRTSRETDEPIRNSEIFSNSPSSISDKLDNFPKYIRRQKLTRLLALYEIFKLSLPVKGSVVECGVNSGFGLMSGLSFPLFLNPSILLEEFMALILSRDFLLYLNQINLAFQPC